jgi:hypothetical protein
VTASRHEPTFLSGQLAAWIEKQDGR